MFRRPAKAFLLPDMFHLFVIDLPPEQMKKLVQGFIWRDEHFEGMTLRDIAKRDGFSEGYVGKCIFKSFNVH